MTNSESGYQWYQTDSAVFVSLLRKGVDPATLKVAFQDKSVTVAISGEVLKQLNLAHPVDPNKSSFNCTPMKIELKLAKIESFQWSSLEAVDLRTSPKVDTQVTTSDGDKPKKTSKYYRDWDAIAKEADEIQEGDSLNNLFQKIFSEANDDTRRAMIKSFTESNGTVLSTNWDEVGKGKVEMKPPDGMEFKAYPR